jgi:hypothetical protein
MMQVRPDARLPLALVLSCLDLIAVAVTLASTLGQRLCCQHWVQHFCVHMPCRKQQRMKRSSSRLRRRSGRSCIQSSVWGWKSRVSSSLGSSYRMCRVNHCRASATYSSADDVSMFCFKRNQVQLQTTSLLLSDTSATVTTHASRSGSDVTLNACCIFLQLCVTMPTMACWCQHLMRLSQQGQRPCESILFCRRASRRRGGRQPPGVISSMPDAGAPT